MGYASDNIYGHGYSKWDTIQEDVADMYLDDEDEFQDDEIALDEDEIAEDVEFSLDEWEEM